MTISHRSQASVVAKSHIVVVGSGVVGVATGQGFAKKGHPVSFVDIDRTRIAELRKQGLDAKLADEVDWNTADIVMLSVSTPTVNGRVYLNPIVAAAEDVGRGLASTDRFITVVVRSTVPPTTTEQIIGPAIERTSGKRAGNGFGLAMNPEFLRQKTSVQDFERPWITVLGVSDDRTARVLRDAFVPFGSLIVQCTPTEAEMIKYVNNIYNAVKISYFNEVHQICEQLNIDSNVVGSAVARSAESMWNPLYGTRGGVPYGGACLPKDTEAFIAFCHENGFNHEMLEATMSVNDQLLGDVPAAQSPDEIDAILQERAQVPHVSKNGSSPEHEMQELVT